MSLDKNRLKTDLTTLYNGTINSTGNAQQAQTAFINGLADTIERYVKGAQINYTTGLVAGSTPVTGTFNGSLT